MKQILCVLLSSLALSAGATVDAYTHAYLVVQDPNSGQFIVERVPLVGCYGLSQGPQLAQFTSEYRVPSSLGCGSTGKTENINALTCAKVLDAKENASFTAFAEITLDISKCPGKDNRQFLSSLRSAADLNFPQEKDLGEVKLNLVK